MKTGFAIYIQDDLSPSLKKQAEDFADAFIVNTLRDPRKRYFGTNGGGYTTGLWRNRLGVAVGEELTFRRISTKQRKFAIVKYDTMVIKNDKHLFKAHRNFRELEPDGEIPKMCRCPKHRGSLKVVWRDNKAPNMTKYAEYGDIKG